MTTDDLFTTTGEAHSRNDNPSTSHEASASMKGIKASRCEAKVITALRAMPNDGLTAWELEKATNLPNETLTPRLAPLRRRGLIKDSGRKRPGGTGRKQIVWVIGDGKPEWKPDTNVCPTCKRAWPNS